MPPKKNKAKATTQQSKKEEPQVTVHATEQVETTAQAIVEPSPANESQAAVEPSAVNEVTEPSTTEPEQKESVTQELLDIRKRRSEFKEQANTFFRNSDWKAAKQAYSAGIDLMTVSPTSPAEDKSLQAVLWTNRAMCSIKLADFRAAIADCELAIQADGSYAKAYYRKAMAHEGLAAGTNLQELQEALTNYTRILKFEPENTDAQNAARRLRTVLEKATVDQRTPLFFINKIRGGKEPQNTSANIKMIMGLCISESRHMRSALDLNFASLLLQYALPTDFHQEDDTIPTAMRALSTLLFRAAVATHKEEAKQQNPSATGAATEGKKEKVCVPLGHEDTEALTKQGAKMLKRLTEYLKWYTTSGKKGEDAYLHGHFLGFLNLIAKYCAHPSFKQFRKPAIEALLSCCIPEEDTKSLAVAAGAIKALTSIAASDDSGLEDVRTVVLPTLLFSKLSSSIKLRKVLVTALAIALGNNPSKKKEAEDKYDKMNKKQAEEEQKKHAEHEQKWTQSVTTLVVSPLLSEDENVIKTGLLALSLVLQAFPTLGIDIVKARWKLHSEEGKPVQVPHLPPQEEKPAEAPPTEREEGEDKKEAGKPEEKEEEGTSALQLLLFLAQDSGDDTQKLATTVLALASSDKVVRETVVAAGNEDLFFDLLKSDDHLIRSYAGVALAKLAVVGEEKRTKEQFEQILTGVLEVLSPPRDHHKKKDEDDEEKEDMFGLEQESKNKEDECIRQIIESVAYLSLNIVIKKLLASHGNGAWLEKVLSYAGHEDKSIRFGVVSIVHNMATSAEDINKAVDQEIDQLRKIAAKGLPGAEQREALTKKAGDPKSIALIRKLLVKANAVRALAKAHAAYVTQFKEEKALTKKHGTPGEAPTEPLKEFIVKSMSTTMLYLCVDKDNRGAIVQQGGLKLLLNLYDFNNDETKTNVAVGIARICITTNPSLFSDGLVFSLVGPLLFVIEKSNNELFQFEATMAITNLASLSPEMRDKIVASEGWYHLTALLSSDNPRCQCAAVEAMCNLVECPKIIERLSSDVGEQDIKLLLMFAGTDDLPTQRAATGALAMASNVPEVAIRIAETVLTSYVLEDEEGNNTEGKRKEYSRNGCVVLATLSGNAELDPDVRVRVDYCVRNVSEALKARNRTFEQTAQIKKLEDDLD